MTPRTLLALTALFTTLAACSQPLETSGNDEGAPPDEEHGDFLAPQGKGDANGIRDASWEGICVLNCVNRAPEQDVRDAVHRIPGDRIIRHRAGQDGVVGTADDVALQTLEELDDVQSGYSNADFSDELLAAFSGAA